MKNSIGKKVLHLMDSAVNFTVLLIFLLLFLYGGYALWDANQIYQAADAANYEIYKPQEEDSLSFEALKKLNQEVIGWISVYGTKIDYPIVQADNNDKYINTNVKGEYSLSGSIFLDYRNKKDFTDFNSILHGHYMEQNAMFGDIGEFKKDNYFSSHRYGNLYVNERNYGLEFFAFLEVDAYDSETYAPGIVGNEAIGTYLDRLLAMAANKSDVSIARQDRIVLLSTCISDHTNRRQILVGRITDATYSDAFKDQKTDPDKRRTDSYSLKELIRNIPAWSWILIGILLILILIVFIGKRRGCR